MRFQKQSNVWRPRWYLPEIEPFQERTGGRLALVSDANVAGKTIVTYNMHLEIKGDDALRCSFANEHVPTTPHSFLEQGRIIDWIFTRGPIRASQPQVHRSVSASDHYPLSITLAFA